MTAVFAYGSLVSAQSAAETLERESVELWPATLRGWTRRFSLVRDNRHCEKTFARISDGSIPELVLGLNIEPAPIGSGAEINGALIATTASEIERLDRRELRYDRIDVTDAISAGHGSPRFDCAFTYVAKLEHFAPEVPAGAVILASYRDVVERAFERLGPGHLDAYRATTGACSAELIEGELMVDRIPSGNPRDW